MVADTSNTRLSKNGTRLSSECAIDILSVLSRMSPTSQKNRSTYCMRVVSSRPATSAYAGAMSSWGDAGRSTARRALARAQTLALLGAERNAVRVGVVPVLGPLARALKVVRAAHPQRPSRLRRALEQALRRPGQLGVRERRLVDAVAAEELVGPLAGEHRLHLLGRYLVHEVERHGARVGRGLVHVPLHARQARPVLLLADVLGAVRDVQLVGQLARPGYLVALALVLGEAHGERLDGGVLLGQACGHVAGVDAARQKRAHLHVGHVVVAHALAHGGVDGLHGVLAAAALVEGVLRAPVAAHLDGAVGAHGHAVGGGQLEDALEERLVERRELEAQVLLERVLVERALVGGVLQDALDLGGEDELRAGRALLHRVVERLDAEEVARAEELAGGAVPDGEREHAAQAVEHALAPGEVAREQHLGVRARLELPALGLELRAQVAVVVDLAVEHDGVVALRGGRLRARAGRAVGHERGGGDGGGMIAGRAHHGLVAALEVDEREPPVPERDAVVYVLPLAVRAAMRHDVAHGLQDGQVGLDSPGEPADSAHGWFSFSRSSATMIVETARTPKRLAHPSPKPQICLLGPRGTRERGYSLGSVACAASKIFSPRR